MKKFEVGNIYDAENKCLIEIVKITEKSIFYKKLTGDKIRRAKKRTGTVDGEPCEWATIKMERIRYSYGLYIEKEWIEDGELWACDNE